MREISRRFKALSEEPRLRIVALLLEHREVCVCEVEHFVNLSQSAASRHLRYLAAEELVEHRRVGQWVFYRLSRPSDRAHSLLLETLPDLLRDVKVVSAAELASFRESRCISVAREADGQPAAAGEAAR